MKNSRRADDEAREALASIRAEMQRAITVAAQRETDLRIVTEELNRNVPKSEGIKIKTPGTGIRRIWNRLLTRPLRTA